MSQILRSPKSRDDLQQIFNYIAEENVAAAKQFLDLINERLRSLAEFPYLGPSKPNLPSEMRSLTVGSYSLYYRPMQDGIILLRVLHNAQDELSKSFAE